MLFVFLTQQKKKGLKASHFFIHDSRKENGCLSLTGVDSHEALNVKL